MNTTIETFGYPASLIQEYQHWVVLLRPQQITLGSMVLALKDEARSIAQAPDGAFPELKRACGDIEAALIATFSADKFNYLMLMMNDPHVHYHVLPRYAEQRNMAGVHFVDAAWPAAPSIATVTPTSDIQRKTIGDALREAWPRSPT